MRGATANFLAQLLAGAFQSTRPMRGATLVRPIIRKVALVISIHAPHAGRDRKAQGV